MTDGNKPASKKPVQISKAPPPISPLRGGGFIPRKTETDRQPRWHKWCLMPEIKEWEAVALSLNIEPGKIDLNSNAWMGAEHPFDESEEFIDRLMILKNHSSNRAHFPTPCKLNMANWYECEVRLDEFAAWCIHVGFEIPPELSALSKTATQAAPQSDSTPTTMIEAAKRAALNAENIAGMLDYVTALMDKSSYPFAKSLDETIPRRQPPAFPTSNREEDTPAINVKSVAVTPPAPAAQIDEINHDAKLAALFDPVTVTALEKTFPADGKWIGWAERANRNGLKDAAKVGRGQFNPYSAAVWFVRKGVEGWDLAKCYRVLANNLPARSRDDKHLLTGNID